MDKIEQYISEVMKNVFTSEDRKSQFESDLRSHIQEKIGSGESVPEVLSEMGTTAEVARGFMEQFEVRLATVWERLVAFILDLGFCCAIGSILFLPLFILPKVLLSTILPGISELGVSIPCGNIDTLESLMHFSLLSVFGIAAGAIMLFYFPVMEHVYGWTIGKRLFRMRVIREEIRKISLGDAFIRRLSFYFDIIALDAIFAVFTKKRQRAFDMIAKTVVIKEDTKPVKPVYILLLILSLFIPVLIYLALVSTGMMTFDFNLVC